MTGYREWYSEEKSGTQRICRDQQQAEPPGDDRDLGASQGHKGGRTNMAIEAGTRRRVQRRASEAGGWWGWEKSRWKTYHDRRGGGDRVYIERGDTPMNATDWGGLGGRRKIL